MIRDPFIRSTVAIIGRLVISAVCLLVPQFLFPMLYGTDPLVTGILGFPSLAGFCAYVGFVMDRAQKGQL